VMNEKQLQDGSIMLRRWPQVESRAKSSLLRFGVLSP
jgi:hypothetical protein